MSIKSEYLDAHMEDENGQCWVKVEYANKLLNERNEEELKLVRQRNDLCAALSGFVNFVSDGESSVVDDEALWSKAEEVLTRVKGNW